MQGVNIWGFFLALAQLAQCSTELASSGEPVTIQVNKPHDNTINITLNNVGLMSKTVEEQFDDLAFLYDKIESAKKDTGLDKKIWPVPHLSKNRTKRQSGSIIPIITLSPIFTGSDEPKTDHCEREEILHQDGDCYEILSQGPCEDTEYVLVDITTRKGFCAPRLCSPDRIFVFEDQQCHDPFENDICPPGRQLFTSCFGTPVCLCPDGTYEEEDDQDEDVCKPVLAEIENCGFGEVFWFTSFRSEAQCIPDPCLGINSKRNPNEMPYIPSTFDGKCYQVGKEIPQCPSDTFYTISFSGLKGICASLEDAGYLVADEEVLQLFATHYGPALEKGAGALPFTTPSRGSEIENLPPRSRKDIGRNSRKGVTKTRNSEDREANQEDETEFESDNIIKKNPLPSPGLSKGLLEFLLHHLRQNRASQRNTRISNKKRGSRKEEEEEQEEQELEEEEEHHRRKRDSLPYASPSNVFEPSLAACRAGAIRGLNNRCRTSILPSRRPRSRPKRRAPPTRPDPSCPLGHFYTIGNRCANNNGQIQASLLSQGLG